MKKLFTLVLLTVTMLSCKKSRNCSCSTTIFYSNSQGFYASKNQPISEKLTEKQAKAVCNHEAENINAMYYNYETNNGNYTATNTFVTNCILE